MRTSDETFRSVLSISVEQFAEVSVVSMVDSSIYADKSSNCAHRSTVSFGRIYHKFFPVLCNYCDIGRNELRAVLRTELADNCAVGILDTAEKRGIAALDSK